MTIYEKIKGQLDSFVDRDYSLLSIQCHNNKRIVIFGTGNYGKYIFFNAGKAWVTRKFCRIL